MPNGVVGGPGFSLPAPLPPIGRGGGYGFGPGKVKRRRPTRTKTQPSTRPEIPAEAQRLQGLIGQIDPTTGRMVRIGDIGRAVWAASPQAGVPGGPGFRLPQQRPVGVRRPPQQRPVGGVPGGPGFRPPRQRPPGGGTFQGIATTNPWGAALQRRASRRTPTEPTALRQKAQALRAGFF